jgi:hypothetical protein
MIKRLNPLGTIEDLLKQMKLVDTAHQTMMSAGARFSQRQTDWVRAKSATTAEQEASVSRQIDIATKELEALKFRLKSAKVGKKKRDDLITPDIVRKNAEAMASGDPTREITLPKMSQLAANATDTTPTAGSRWTSISINSNEVSQMQSSSTQTEVSQENWSVSFFGMASASGVTNTPSSHTNIAANSSNLSVEISMNCTMVTCDRSSWFQPQFFDMSDAFMRNNSKMSWHSPEWPEEWENDVSKAVDAVILEGKGSIPKAKALLPCFPTGYIIAKDVLIKISRFDIKTVADKRYLEEKTNSGASFLFFSTSKPGQKTEDSSSSGFDLASDGMIVRIPGPQIIGYIQQMLPWDYSHPFKSDESLKPDIFLPGDEVTNTDRGDSVPNSTKEDGRTIAHGLNMGNHGKDDQTFVIRSTKPTPGDLAAPGSTVDGNPTQAHALNPSGGTRASSFGGDHAEINDGDVAQAIKIVYAKLGEKLRFFEGMLSSKN